MPYQISNQVSKINQINKNMAYIGVTENGASPVNAAIGLKRAEKELIMRRYNAQNNRINSLNRVAVAYG